jgi:hypothetical protein
VFAIHYSSFVALAFRSVPSAGHLHIIHLADYSKLVIFIPSLLLHQNSEVKMVALKTRVHARVTVRNKGVLRVTFKSVRSFLLSTIKHISTDNRSCSKGFL